MPSNIPIWLWQWSKFNGDIPQTMHASQRRRWHPTPVLLPGKSHGQRSLVGCRLWGYTDSDTTERLPFSLSCIGGNGNPLQCSCLENPRDGGAWWAAVYGVTQNRTWLKWLSSMHASRGLPKCGPEYTLSGTHWFRELALQRSLGDTETTYFCGKSEFCYGNKIIWFVFRESLLYTVCIWGFM